MARDSFFEAEEKMEEELRESSSIKVVMCRGRYGGKLRGDHLQLLTSHDQRLSDKLPDSPGL